ncbi:MAG: transposase, partial [Acinetobacter tandoii]|uniref:transposase n=1 Tax=Acinetobacter tandoii TaxID=202954 RepID=UPI003D6C241E
KAFFTALKYNNSHLFKHLPCYQRMIHLMNTHQLALYALHFALMKDQQSNYLMVEQLVKGMTAKLYADRSYISHELKRWLKDQDIDLMTYHRKNMQVIKLSKADNYHLKQRNKIETLFSLLKGTYNLVTSKARSITGYLTGIYASLCAYQLCHQNKPMIRLMETSA